MRRRSVLGLVGATIVPFSGCSDGGQVVIGETETLSPRQVTLPDRSPTMTNTPLESPFPRYVAVEGVDDESLRETHGIGADVAVVDNEVTANDTARVEIALRTSGGQERSVTYAQADCDRNEFRATTGDFGLYLLPVGGDWTTDETDCPVVGYPNLECGIPVVKETVTVPATDPLVWRYDVVVPPRNVDEGGCAVPGRYRYTREFTAAESSATLAFDLSVAAP